MATFYLYEVKYHTKQDLEDN